MWLWAGSERLAVITPVASIACCGRYPSRQYLTETLSVVRMRQRADTTSALDLKFEGVVKFEVTGAAVDWLQPWKVGQQKEWGGSGGGECLVERGVSDVQAARRRAFPRARVRARV